MTTWTWDGLATPYVWSNVTDWIDPLANHGIPGPGDTALVGSLTIDAPSAFTDIVISFGTPGSDGDSTLVAPAIDFGWRTVLVAPSTAVPSTLEVLGTDSLDDGSRPPGSLAVPGSIDLQAGLVIQLGGSAAGGMFVNQGAITGDALSILSGGSSAAVFENDETMDLHVLNLGTGTTLDGSGAVVMTSFNANVSLLGGVGSGQLIQFTQSTHGVLGGGVFINDLSQFLGTIELTASNDITINGFGAGKQSYDGAVLTFTNGKSINVRLDATASDVVVINEGGSTVVEAIACFAAGTRIATPCGDVAVEALRVGDVVRLADGQSAPVRWLGHRRVDCARHPRPWDVWPVRVAPGAFGDGAPSRTLFLSPDHAVLVAGALIPVRYLVNGATIAQVPHETVTYWHVELDRHAVLLAEGLPCESFLDTGNRTAFANGGVAVQAHPDFARSVWAERACAPLVLEGPELVAARTALLRRAASLGHVAIMAPDLRLDIGGRTRRGVRAGPTYRWRLPAGTGPVRLLSRAAPAAWTDPASADWRPLGTAVAALRLNGASIPLDDARLGSGWHAPEPAWRWTDGVAGLDVGPGVLEVDVAMAGRTWRETRGKGRRAA